MGSASRIKQQLKNASYFAIAAASQVGRLASRRPAPLLRVLMYHKVDGQADNAPNVSPALFGAQMEHVARSFRPVGLEQVVAALCEDTPLPDRAVLVTFDDGYRDNLVEAAPILRRLGIPAVLFLPTEFVERDRPLPHDEGRSRRGIKNPTLSWDEVRRLLDQGFEIGSHGESHRVLSTLDPREAAGEISRSRVEIERQIGRPVRAFAYVKGAPDTYDQRTIEAVREAGYAIAFSTLPGPVRRGDSPWEVRRYNVEPFGMYTFRRMLEGDCDLIALKDSPRGLRAKRWLDRVLGTTTR